MGFTARPKQSRALITEIKDDAQARLGQDSMRTKFWPSSAVATRTTLERLAGRPGHWPDDCRARRLGSPQRTRFLAKAPRRSMKSGRTHDSSPILESLFGSDARDHSVEEKDFSLVWHYRRAEPELAYVQKPRNCAMRWCNVDREHGRRRISKAARYWRVRKHGINKGHAARTSASEQDALGFYAGGRRRLYR